MKEWRGLDVQTIADRNLNKVVEFAYQTFYVQRH